MSGMTTTLGSNNVSDYNSRIALVEVGGVFPSNVMRKNPYTMKVPVSRLSQTLQRISRAGGKVQSVTIQSPSYGEVNSGVSSPELRVVDVPANPVPSSTDTEQVESFSEVAPVEHHQTEITENQTIPVLETEITENQTASVLETEITENQTVSVPEIDSDEYAANIGGDGEKKGFISGIGAKLTQITKTNKSNKKTTGKQDKKSKRKRKN